VPDLALLSLLPSPGTIAVVAVHDEDPAALATYVPLIGDTRPVSAVAADAFTSTVFAPHLDLDAIAPLIRADSLAALRGVGARGWIVVPLRSRGELLGLLTVVRHRPELPPLDETDCELARAPAPCPPCPASSAPP